ncbi:hypothetical protein B0T16DRAFT_423133 [Cercophora newfieldiana]|uniref:Uncharacterized protein n=1 Tax=Cercophora newfieldiana TaxID=92897 RepID=A0AA39XSG3_9PEZI|nr:hypothetical protein B0T16DRAFT_423133 [Cercophora newfieldiana]
MASTSDFETTLRSPVDDDVLQGVYASDQEMYPAPLTFTRLKSWVDACPDLSICFRRSGATPPVGVVIALPIRQPYWDDLLHGTLKETDIDPDVAFPNRELLSQEEVEDVGLHVFHIERFAESAKPVSGTKRKGFAEFSVEEIIHRASLRKKWKVVGLSALTATPAGKKTFQRLGFAPTGYSETFLAEETNGVSAKDKVRMVCTFPGDNPSDLSDTSAQSEMLVKYL